MLVHPGAAVSTAEVFQALEHRTNAAIGPDLDKMPEVAGLAVMRNDLQAPAMALAPEIRDVLAALQASAECLLARMSGSGATCFGLFRDEATAQAAARQIRQTEPGWWIAATRFGSVDPQRRIAERTEPGERDHDEDR